MVDFASCVQFSGRVLRRSSDCFSHLHQPAFRPHQQTGQADQEHGPFPWKVELQQEIENPRGPRKGVFETGDSRLCFEIWSGVPALGPTHICLSTLQGKVMDLFSLESLWSSAAEGMVGSGGERHKLRPSQLWRAR